MCLPPWASHTGGRARPSGKRLGLGHIEVRGLAPELNGYFEPWASCKTSQPLLNHKKGETTHRVSRGAKQRETACEIT